MGNIWGWSSSTNDASLSEHSSMNKRKSRDWDVEEELLESSSFGNIKRKKLRSTSNYIYNELYVKGENSDVTICALGHEWHLHKVYLRQAGYFSGMFQGSWKESCMKVIDLHIPDEKINEEALKITFGSLYSDEVVILPTQVVSVLAAASLIQLEGLMDQCSEVMIKFLSCENVCCFYNESRIYGQKEVEAACLQWFQNNLMLKAKNLVLLNNIDASLMAKIVNSTEIFVLQVEMDIYTMLKKWMYLKILSEEEKLQLQTKIDKDISSTARSYFRDQFRSSGEIFLSTEGGLPFVEVFQAVRFGNILRDFGCCLEVEKDGVIPHSWLVPMYRERWLTMLRVEQGVDHGPDDLNQIDHDSLRCGRVLHQDMDYCWRWNGYNFGLDLLITYSSQRPRMLLLKRNIQSQRRIASVGYAARRKIIYHLRVYSLDDKGKVLDFFSAGPSKASLEKDEEKVVLTLEEGRNETIKFPLMVSASFRVVSAKNMDSPSCSIAPLPSDKISS